MVRGALVMAVFGFGVAGASAQAYDCTARVALGYDGAVIADWRNGETHGRVTFTFDAASGAYVERKEGSAAAITGGGKLTVVGGAGEGYGAIVAVSETGSLVLKLDDSVHGVNYVRLGHEGLAEIGTCERLQ